MSAETPTAAELEIPAAVLKTMLDIVGDEYMSDEEIADDVRRVAAPVVAAELRRLANVGYWCDDTDISQEVDRALRARADELDPPARQEG